MKRCLLMTFTIVAVGCGKPPSTEQPEPVQLERKFFENTNDPGKVRKVPNPPAK